MPDIDSLEIITQPGDDLSSLPLEDKSIIPASEVEEDFISRTVKEDEGPDNVLKAVMIGLAEEQSALKTLRKYRQTLGKDTSNISLRRGTLLKFMSETILQRQALSTSTSDLDVHSAKFREVFKLFLGVISDTFDEVKIPSEYKELFFSALSRNLEGWEDKAEKVIKALEAPRG